MDELFKQTIEDFLIDGYGPLKSKPGSKGAAVTYAARHLMDTNKVQNQTVMFLYRWVEKQERLRDEGKPHFLPDWNLYPPYAAKNGELGYAPVLPGFEVTSISSQLDADGKVTGQHIKQKQATSAEPFELPAGHFIKGISAWTDAEGKVRGQWIKTKEGPNGPEATDAILAAFAEYTGHSELVPPPAATNGDMLTEYVIGDHHLGMFSWRSETGHDYDTRIGEKLLLDAMTDLVARSPASHTAVVLNLGDFFHTDSSSNRTPASGNQLDVDTRRSRVYKIGVKLMIAVIEMALQKHEKVIVRNIPGNHDPETTPTLTWAMWAFFHNNDRVEVDTSASPFWVYEWGTTMLAATHGDKAKIQDMPMIMAATEPAMWGRTRYRYAAGGHIHHKERFAKAVGGMMCETFEVLPPPDAWHAGMGYGSGRSMTAIHYHKRRGEYGRHVSNVSPEDTIELLGPA